MLQIMEGISWRKPPPTTAEGDAGHDFSVGGKDVKGEMNFPPGKFTCVALKRLPCLKRKVSHLPIIKFQGISQFFGGGGISRCIPHKLSMYGVFIYIYPLNYLYRCI